MSCTETHISENEETTRDIAGSLAGKLVPGDVVALEGDLGTGKTVFAKGLIHSLGVGAPVTSPTFTLIHEYGGDMPLYHMDLYRLGSREELLAIGVEEYVYGDGVCIIEWAEKCAGMLPAGTYRVRIMHAGGTRRHIHISREDAHER